jgi:hypothetical protein
VQFVFNRVYGTPLSYKSYLAVKIQLNPQNKSLNNLLDELINNPIGKMQLNGTPYLECDRNSLRFFRIDKELFD